MEYRGGGEDDPDHRGFQFSPLLIGLLGIIAGSMVVATYRCIFLGCCRGSSQQRSQGNNTSNTRQDIERTINNDDHHNRQDRITSGSGSVMRVSMPVIRYSKDCNEDTCSVCLCDFKEGERIRVLPECLHLFHVPCIDMWLSSHSNCPLCRANVIAHPPRVVLTSPDWVGASMPESIRVLDLGVV